MSSTLVKWIKVPPRRAFAVSVRLKQIKECAPVATPQLLSFGQTMTGYFRLEFARIDGVPLSQILKTCPGRKWIYVQKVGFQALANWRKRGFVHGDLSPRNILIDAVNGTPWFIDWLLDLESFQGTPRYCSPSAFCGQKNHDSDDYAFQKIMSCGKLYL